MATNDVKKPEEFASFCQKRASKLTSNHFYLMVFKLHVVLVRWKNQR